MSRVSKAPKLDARAAAQRNAYAAHMEAQRAQRPTEAPPGQHEAARLAAMASKLDGLGRQHIISYLKAGATIEKDVVEWRALLMLKDGRWLSVFRHHLEQVQNEGYA